MIKATPIKLDVSTGFKTVTLMVADFAPFMDLGKPLEMSVAPLKEPAPDPANLVKLDTQAAPAGSSAPQPPTDSGNFPPGAEKVTSVAPFESRPTASGMPLGAANAGNPNACPVCYGHGLVREFRGENDITGTTASCKACGGTGINRENQTPPTVATSAIQPCENCKGDGNDPENGGKPCPVCDGTGIKPANT